MLIPSLSGMEDTKLDLCAIRIKYSGNGVNLRLTTIDSKLFGINQKTRISQMLKPFNNRTRATIVGNHISNRPSSTNTIITDDQCVENIGQIAGDTVSSIQTEKPSNSSYEFVDLKRQIHMQTKRSLESKTTSQ